jgi:hypothetical protein
MASATEEAINSLAIARLKLVTKEFDGDLAKSAKALERLLASDRPSPAAMQKHVLAFGKAAAELTRSRPRPKTKMAATGKAGRKAKVAKRMTKSAGGGYTTPVFRCMGHYQKCCESGVNKTICVSLAILCIIHQLKLQHITTAAVTATKIFSGH